MIAENMEKYQKCKKNKSIKSTSMRIHNHIYIYIYIYICTYIYIYIYGVRIKNVIRYRGICFKNMGTLLQVYKHH